MAHIIFSIRFDKKRIRSIWNLSLIAIGVLLLIVSGKWEAAALIAFGINNLFAYRWKENRKQFPNLINIGIALVVVVNYLTVAWMPLGAENSTLVNFLFVIGILVVVLGTLMTVVHFYPEILKWCLANKWKFLAMPAFLVLFGILIWQGTEKTLGFIPDSFKRVGLDLRNSEPWLTATKAFPGIGKEFMPSLDEGSFLLMPTTMPHSGVEENTEVIRQLDMRVNTIPEVESVVGKWGRVNSALDPAPISMFENIINYRPEYILDEDGHRMRFKTDKNGAFILKDGTTYDPKKEGFRLISKDQSGRLIPNGEYFRQWRDNIRTPDDIWKEIVDASKIPGYDIRTQITAYSNTTW